MMKSRDLTVVDLQLATVFNGIFSWQAAALRNIADEMADAVDRDAQRDIEGAREWRDLNNHRRFRYEE